MAWKIKREALEMAIMNKGMSLKALQDAAHVSPRTLYLMIRGKTCPRFETIGKIAVALGVPASEIAESVEE